MGINQNFQINSWLSTINVRGWKSLFRHCKSVKATEVAQPSFLRWREEAWGSLFLKLEGQSLASQALGQHKPDWKKTSETLPEWEFWTMKHFQSLNWFLIYHFQVGSWKNTTGESYSMKTLLTGKVLKFRFLQVIQSARFCEAFCLQWPPLVFEAEIPKQWSPGLCWGGCGVHQWSVTGKLWEALACCIRGSPQRCLTGHIETRACALHPWAD